jgi:RimJ/RimL family protein N-acetyltransferase
MSSRNGKSGNVCVAGTNHRHARSEQIDAIDYGRPVRGITLRQVTDEDGPFLFRLLTDPFRSHLWMPNRKVYAEYQFRDAWRMWMDGMFAETFVIERNGQPIGLIFAYDQYLEHGITKIGEMLQEESMTGGAGAIAWALFIDYLFRTLPLRKIYMEVHGFNPSVSGMFRKVELAEEGILKADHYWDGSYWDLHIFAAYREAWPKVRRRILGARWPDAQALNAGPDRNSREGGE